MTHQLTRTLLLTWTALSLAACGGGGGGGGNTGGGIPPGGGGTPPATVDPISSAGFASMTTDFSDGGTSFETQSDNIIWVSNDGTVVEQDETIRLSFNGDLSVVTVTRSNEIGGRIERFEVQLDRSGSTDNYSRGTLFLGIEETADNQDARLALIGDRPNFINGHTNFVTYGFDTDPAAMPTSGSADFTGNVHAAYAPNTARSLGTASGTFTLTADFQNGRVDGDMTIGALSAGSNSQGSTAWTMDVADITANGFSGTLTDSASNPVDADTTVNAANYDGRFYGTDADAVGGHFLIELTDDGEDTYIYGAFLGDED